LKKLKKLLAAQTGAVEMTSLVLMSWLVIMLMTAGADIFLMVSRFITVDNVAQSAIEMMKNEGRFTEGAQSIEEWFHLELAERGVPSEDIMIADATRTVTQRGEPLYLHVRTRYALQSFRPLGITAEQLTVPWDIRKSGISRKFIRDVVVIP